MRALNIKVWRDLRRSWAQALAIALVVAAGTATIILAMGSLRSLEVTRDAYYERYQFAQVFANVRRAPKSLLARVAEIPGIAAVEGRVEHLAPIAVEGFPEPVTGRFLSLPNAGQPLLNRLSLRLGRLPDPAADDEVVVADGFASAHALPPGSRFSAVLNGRERTLTIVGTALSPEFVYALGPGDRTPDDRHFGIVWMSEKALAAAYDLQGAFSSVSVTLTGAVPEAEVIRGMDRLLDPYGGQGAYGRKDQISDAYVNHGMDMLRNMSRTLPPIFLLVAAFLMHVTLARIVALEREQIGLLKALGYSVAAITWHYLKFVVVIVFVGLVMGAAAGTFLGRHVTALYGDLFRFPLLIFVRGPDLYILAGGLNLIAAVLGAARALRVVVTLPPAVAMLPPAPPVFRHMGPSVALIGRLVSQPTVMMVRGLTAHPLRAIATALGMAFATAILVASLFLNGTMDELINITYFQSDRQDASVAFVERRPLNVVTQFARLPGVLAAEPYREVPVRIRYAGVERRIIISGRDREADLRRIINVDLRPVTPPEDGLAISAWLANTLRVKAGDVVEVDLLGGQRRTVFLPVHALVEDYFGMQGMMDANSLARLMHEQPTVTSVSLVLDPDRLDSFYQAIRRLPGVTGTTMRHISLNNFRAVIATLVTTMSQIYIGLAAVIAFGVVYNSARIALSERARDLASLRVLGFRRHEVARILLLELALITVIAQPPGWAIGYGLAWLLQTKMAGELMRARLIVEPSTYAYATMITFAAAAGSAVLVWNRLARLDLVAVLKTRE